ncbi:DUF6470 family protein [Paenibacillus glufosinatiresistens]|uniref:DUF6470 family protein n=1 Tax=Paenibacillus glufosinatiresistens TaxID=3070657 RepID=UPI00286DCA9C|nr:DUF6470 family protein [Paenibacillus sp. YX.27]
MQPVLQIIQTRGILEMQTTPGAYSIRQPKADLNIQTTPGQLRVESEAPQLQIDGSRVRSSMTGGNWLEMNQRIYDGIKQRVLQNIASRMQQGDRMMNYQRPGNTIAEIYGSDWQPQPFPETRTAASSDNLNIRIITTEPSVTFRPSRVNVEVTAHAPQIEYNRGSISFYMKQYAGVQYIPPEVDMQL